MPQYCIDAMNNSVNQPEKPDGSLDKEVGL